ncbi:MAG: leucine-rich repeat domain-containing protein [Lachnospiraceae bacterium]|nr:leucine-rich repeat domain-containing protein [Lachnospiraceae bacterium]
MMLNDRQILEMFERSDERALMETTAKYETFCRTVAFTILGEETAAKECFRDALRKSWKSCPPMETKSLKTYMGRLTRDIAFRYPEEDPRVANAAEIERIVNELDDCVGPEYVGADIRDENDGVVETLNAFLASLSASKRRLFTLRYWYGMPARTIADRCDLSSEEVQTELSALRGGLNEAFREARTLWPVDGKMFMLKRIGEIDDAFISEAESSALKAAGALQKNESRTSDDFEDEETNGRRRPFPWKNKQVAGIAAGVLAVVGLIFAVVWYMNREIPIDKKHFPDKTFRAYVANRIDLDGNGKLSKDERSGVFRIDITQELPQWEFHLSGLTYVHYEPIQIDSLKGVGYFPNLESLTCTGVGLKSLDVSANRALEYLNCSNNLLTELDVRSNKALEELDCSQNRLQELKFRSNEVLETLSCYNNQLTDLKVASNKALKTLYCFNNSLLELDLSGNTMLETISCTGNQLQKLDFSKNSVLKWADCSDNALNALNVKENPMLKVLGCNNNQLQNLDLSGCPKLTALSCERNPLTSLDLLRCKSLAHLYVDDDPMMTIQLNENVISDLVEE